MARKPTSVTFDSSKDIIWDEKERLEKEVRVRVQQIAVLEDEVEKLQRQSNRLEKKNEYADRLKDDLSNSIERLDLVARVTRELASLDTDRIFDIAITKIPYILNARHASVYLYDEEKDRLILKKHSHKRELDHVVEISEHPNSLMARVLREGIVQIIGDINNWESKDEKKGNLDRRFADYYMTSSCIIAPLKMGSRVLGILNLADKNDGSSFDMNEDLSLVEQVAGLLASSLHNSQLFETVQRQAGTDSLTGLNNYQGFLEVLDQELNDTTKADIDRTLVIIDIDRFAGLNENYGHTAGDQVICDVADLIREHLTSADRLARYGADEFAILLSDRTKQTALEFAQLIKGRVEEQTFHHEGADFDITLSIGIAQLTEGQDAAELVRDAEKTLASAKSSDEGIEIRE